MATRMKEIIFLHYLHQCVYISVRGNLQGNYNGNSLCNYLDLIREETLDLLESS